MAKKIVECAQPYFLAKPYAAPHLHVLQDTLHENNVKIAGVYRIDDWSTAAKAIYSNTTAREGKEWEEGLRVHLKLITEMWGHRGLCIVLNDPLTESVIERDLTLKAQVRAQLPFGPGATDMVMMVNLDTYEHGEACGAGSVGELRAGERTIGSRGRWDDYYFKYFHAPDTVDDARKEWHDLRDGGVFQRCNRVSMADFGAMVECGTYVTPSEMIRARKRLLA
jgi:hypothetical protein